MTLPSKVLKAYLEGMTLVESHGATADIGNAQAYSVSELAFALKRTIEDAYGFVRLRGEISKVTRHASGHIYLTLKDERACIDAVVWKGSVRGLQCQPQTGLEVVVTGKITTYPARSSYQMVIETMEPAGIGALLAQLERLKTKLQAEGLFESHRKRALPTSPAVIGVITSPTGAVIRDILHRIRDRWPCHVVVWPVVVQGAEAAAQVAAAVKGFNAIDKTGALPRPEIIIIARGGGSIEDLWPFNDEVLARTVAAGEIPLISAVGHETDITLIDFVSDRRAPTPSAAAEMATPVLVELKAAVANFEHRTSRCIARALELRRARLDGARRGLPRPEALLALANQRFDMASGRLGAGLTRNVDAHERQLVRAAARLSPHMLNLPIANQAQRLSVLGPRLLATTIRLVERRAERLERAERLLRSLHPEAPLVRGFALVRGLDGALVRSARGLKSGDALQLKFADGAVKAKVEGNTGAKSAERKQAPPNQGDLF